MKFKKIVSTWLQSSDLARTKDFMLKLGLTILMENDTSVIFNYPEDGPNTAYYLYPEPLNDGAPMRKGGVLTIEVDDISSLLKKCKELSLIPEDTQIYTQESFISFLLTDPDGNLFEIIQHIE